MVDKVEQVTDADRQNAAAWLGADVVTTSEEDFEGLAGVFAKDRLAAVALQPKEPEHGE